MTIRRVMTIMIGMLLLSSFAFPILVAAPDIIQPEEHEPISIDGNEDFVTTASEEGWPGTGSEESPIVIKGLSITSNTSCIYIANVDLHFRIEECLIQASETTTGWLFGILIKNCSYATIEECVVQDQEFGICLWNSDGAIVKRTEIYESFFGVFVNNSAGVWLYSLDIVVCNVGIRLNGSRYASIEQTIIDNCEYSGIEGINDFGTLLRHNFIVGSEVGVAMFENENWVFEESIVESCNIGIDVSRSFGGFVIRAMIKNCSEYGIYLGRHSSNISIIENWFGPDNTLNAQDDGEGNLWYDDYTQVGNYWSDYEGEGSYLIPGSAGSIDLYPTSLADAPNWEDVVTIDGGSTTSKTTTIDDDFSIDGPTLYIAVGSAVVILLVAVAMVRSRVSP